MSMVDGGEVTNTVPDDLSVVESAILPIKVGSIQTRYEVAPITFSHDNSAVVEETVTTSTTLNKGAVTIAARVGSDAPKS